MKMLSTLLCGFLFLPAALAETGAATPQGLKGIEKQGQLFVVKLIPGKRAIVLEVAGKRVADFVPSGENVEAFFKPVGASEEEKLDLKGDGKKFAADVEKPGELRVRVKKGKKSEEFKFPLK